MNHKETRINRRIRVPEIRLIDADGKQLGVFITSKAIELAENQGLDLVELSPNASPPVCKIMDYGKYKYQQTKKLKESKKHQVVVTVKEVKFRPVTDEHDLSFKVRNMQRFLEEGHKVKATVVFRGREMSYRQGGQKILQTILEMLKDKAVVEVPPKMEGRQMATILTPAKQAGKKE
ncbi:MAG TPA: translation initiation factor IF-3 [Deltaproteobacteria bacterium]|nr:translation initiation factor IF-3 [Deltaproteobacteria bacterium]